MDTFEWTKIGGALCGALLFFLLLNWGTEIIYHSHDDYYGEEKLAYYLEVEVSNDEKEESSEEVVDFATLLASADVEKGKKVFGKCKSCHKLEDGAIGAQRLSEQVRRRAKPHEIRGFELLLPPHELDARAQLRRLRA